MNVSTYPDNLNSLHLDVAIDSRADKTTREESVSPNGWGSAGRS
jgi:hypothetical protein